MEIPTIMTAYTTVIPVINIPMTSILTQLRWGRIVISLLWSTWFTFPIWFQDDIYLLREPIVPNRLSRPTTRRQLSDNEQQIREVWVREKNISFGRLFSKRKFTFQITTTTTTSATTNYRQIEPAIQQILRTIESMRIDLQRINSRIDVVERSMNEVKNHQLRKKVGVNVDINVLNSSTITIAKHSKLKIMALKYPRWWPFSDISPNWFFILILWPFLARQLARMLQRKTK